MITNIKFISPVEVFQTFMIDDLDEACAKAKPNIKKWHPKTLVVITEATAEL